MTRAALSILTVMVSTTSALLAQDLNAPPVTTFKPDTSLPKVSLPEFVITGRSQMELPRTDKPGVAIDSSYFQNKELQSGDNGVPLERSLTAEDVGYPEGLTSLFAHASYGHYTTADYLLSAGGALQGYLMNASIGGNYTSGFIPLTMGRDFSTGAGVSKDLVSDATMKWSSTFDVGYARSSYYLYGDPLPNLLRMTNRYHVGLNSDLEIGPTPLQFNLGYERYSISDLWEGVEGTAKVQLATRISISSGDIRLGLDYLGSTHSLAPAASAPAIYYTPFTTTGIIDRLPYYLHIGGSYDNGIGNLSYSLAIGYFQYTDDSTSGISKLYPDLKIIYRFGDSVSVFARFFGRIDQADMQSFVSTDRFVNGYIPLENAQRFADFTVGSTISLIRNVTLIPQFNLKSEKYLPVFASVPSYNNVLVYAKRATVYKISLESKYSENNLSAGLVLEYQKGTADSLGNIPNLPPFLAALDGLYRFTPDLALSGNFTFLSKRYTDLALTQQVGTASILDMRFSYTLGISGIPFEFFVEGKNLFNQKYYIWQNYQEFPLSLFIGLNCRIR
ncbi:MAG TPA: hypothetical protein VIS48_13700 [Candidatus Kryptonia bacterium]